MCKRAATDTCFDELRAVDMTVLDASQPENLSLAAAANLLKVTNWPRLL
jgi:hypothetical protein